MLEGEKVEVESVPRPAAYLGPKLWEKPIQQFNEDDFLMLRTTSWLRTTSRRKSLGMPSRRNETSPEPESMRDLLLAEIKSNQIRPPSSIDFGVGSHSPTSVPPRAQESSCQPQDSMKKNLLPKGRTTMIRVQEAKMEREKEKRRMEVDMEFAPEDLALAFGPAPTLTQERAPHRRGGLRPSLSSESGLAVRPPRWRRMTGTGTRGARTTWPPAAPGRPGGSRRTRLRSGPPHLEKENAMLKADLDEATFERTKLAMERALMKKLAKYE